MADNIPVYNNPVDKLTVPDTGVRMAEQAGRVAQHLGDETAAAMRRGSEALGRGASEAAAALQAGWNRSEDVLANQEITRGIKEGSARTLQAERDMDDIIKNTPADQVQGKIAEYMDKFNQSTSEWAGGFQTTKAKQWLERHMAEQGASLSRSAAAHGSQAAGFAVQSSAIQSINTHGVTAYQFPERLDAELSAVEHDINSLVDSSPMKGTDAVKAKTELLERARTEIVGQAARAYIDRNPTAGLSQLDKLSQKYPQYMTPQLSDTLRTYQYTKTRQERADTLAQRADDRSAVVDADRVTQLGLLNGVYVDENGEHFPPGFSQRLMDAREKGQILPSTFQHYADRYRQAAMGELKATDQRTFEDFTSRLLLPPGDPRTLTVPEVTAALGGMQLSSAHANFVLKMMGPRGLTDADKSQIALTKQRIADSLNSGGRPMSAVESAAIGRAGAYMWGKFQEGEARGIRPVQMLNPDDPEYIFKPDPSIKGDDGFKRFLKPGPDAAAAVQSAHPTAVAQQKASSAVDLAVKVTNLMRDNQPEAVNELLAGSGVRGIDVRNSAWCAALVNAALKDVGLPTTPNNLAVSFKRGWGSAVAASEVNKGDVFYAPPSGEGDTGHVGFVVGPPRIGANGQMQVQVVSTHLQGAQKNIGGVEWRDTRSLLFRRAMTPVNQVSQAADQPGALTRFFNGVAGVFQTRRGERPTQEQTEKEE